MTSFLILFWKVIHSNYESLFTIWEKWSQCPFCLVFCNFSVPLLYIGFLKNGNNFGNNSELFLERIIGKFWRIIVIFNALCYCKSMQGGTCGWNNSPGVHSYPGTRCRLKNCGIARMPTNQMRAVIVNCRHIANRGCSFHYIGLHPRHFAVDTANITLLVGEKLCRVM